MNPNLITLMEELYSSEAEARAILIHIGYRASAIPAFGRAEIFWPDVLRTLDDRVDHGTVALVKAVVERNPGSAAAADLLTELTEQAMEPEPELASRRGPWSTEESAAGTPPPLPPPVTVEGGISFDAEECPTLTLEGADLPEQFLGVARELAGADSSLLYSTRVLSAVRIPDPGDQDEAVRYRVQQRMRTFERDCRVTYRKFPFRPYVYKWLVVYGPDTTLYKAEDVPATFTPEDIAAKVVAETREAQSVPRDGLVMVRVVIDHESAETSRRLDPYTTLHECGVCEGDSLRVAPDAVAGSLSPELRMEAQLRAAAQIRGYAARHHARFAIVGYDDEELPGRITVEVTTRGLAPPADLDSFLAEGGQGALEELTPVVVPTHRVSIHFRAMFPLVAPHIIWETPVFHPNIRWQPREGFPAGTLQYHPLLMGYRPEYDMARIAELITAVVMYRDYDLTEEFGSPNPTAAQWAGTQAGQDMIHAIGGSRLGDVLREGDPRTRPARLFWLKPLER